MSLRFRDVIIRHGKTVALDRITVELSSEPGVTGLIGPNGAGKTTFIEAAVGVRRTSAGRVEVDSSRIAYCQDATEFESHLTASEILKTSILYGGAEQYTEAKIESALEKVSLTEHRTKYATTFSRGMKQRLAIAASLVLEPQILFLDEPTSALDPLARRDVLTLIRMLAENIRIVISTHLLEDVGEVADDLIVLNKGKLAYAGSATDFLGHRSDGWDIHCATAQDVRAVLEFLDGNSVALDTTSLDRHAFTIPLSAVSRCLSLLADGPWDRIADMGPSAKPMYGAFEEVVGESVC